MNVLLVGLGRMGERYRQTLERLAERSYAMSQIVTVDPKSPTKEARHHYASLQEVPRSIEFTLAIDARPNLGRLEVFQDFLQREIPYLVIEKPSAGSWAEALAMRHALDHASYTPRVLVPFYRRFLEAFSAASLHQLEAGPLRSMVISAGAIGLGCNGIHYLDLANSLFQSHPTRVWGQLSLNSVPSPRGAQFHDHSGTLILQYSTGSCLLHLLPESAMGIQTTLLYERGKIQIMEQQQSHWQWYRQPDAQQELPHYRTHLEALVEPPHPFQLDLLGLMERGLTALLNDGPVPSMAESEVVLKTIALAVESHESGQALPWEQRVTTPERAFQFT